MKRIMKIPISQQVNNLALKVLGYFQRKAEGVNDVNNSSLILCYHSISDDKWDFSVSPAKFTKQIEDILQTREIVSLTEILKYNGEMALNKVAITFDDGYEDIYKNAYPILKKLKIPATVFVIGNDKLVNRANLGNDKRLLSINQIKALKNAGWGIGFHSKTHRKFQNLGEEALRDEIVQGKKNLEKRLGFRLKYFTYPNGFYSSKIIDIIKEAGFEFAFNVDGGAVNKSHFPYKVERVVVNKYLSSNNFEALISNYGLLYSNIFTRILKAKDNLIYKLTVTV